MEETWRKGGDRSRSLENLFDFLEDDEGMSDEEIKEELRAEGIDPEAVLARGKSIVEAGLREAKMSWRKRAHEKMESFDRRVSLSGMDTPSTGEEAMRKIRDLLGSIPAESRPRYAQFYSKLGEVTEDEAISVYQDLQRLKLLEDEEEG
jgi:hypothetical protein